MSGIDEYRPGSAFPAIGPAVEEPSPAWPAPPTGSPDFKTGKGAPGRGQLYVDDRLVANAEPPFAFNGAFHSARWMAQQ